MNESKRRAFAALGIGPIWRPRASPAHATGAVDDPALMLLPDTSGEWLFVCDTPSGSAGGNGAVPPDDPMRLLERMLAALDLRPAQVPVGNSPSLGGARRDVDAVPGDPLAARIDALAPRVVVALGSTAARTLLGTDAEVPSLRGRVHEWRAGEGARVLPLVVSWHPSRLLEAPHEKADAWFDLCLARAARAPEPD